MGTGQKQYDAPPRHPYAARILLETWSREYRERQVAYLELESGRRFECPIVGELLGAELERLERVILPVCEDDIWLEFGRRYEPKGAGDPMTPYIKLLFSRRDYDRTHGLSKTEPDSNHYQWLKYQRRVAPIVTMQELYYD